MNRTHAALTLAFAGIACGLLLKRRRAAAPHAEDGLAPFPSVDPGSLGAGAPATGGAGGRGADSPNDAERLQAAGVAAASADERRTGDLFQSTSQDSPYARAPGLPDFARGA